MNRFRDVDARGISKGEIDRSVEGALLWIGEELRRLRLARGLTQSEMEERGVSHKYYQRIETGRANVTVRTLVLVMKALEVEFPPFCNRLVRRGARGTKIRYTRRG
ncbi:MAG: helix-turn-helix transcriptional regulator [Candidatus Manganitrophaceae bacterium]